MMERRLQYSYVHIDPKTGECVASLTTSYIIDDPEWIQVSWAYPEYVGKYYKNGNWYEDAEFTIPWTPPV